MKKDKSVIFFLILVIFLLFLGCGSRKSSIDEKKDIHTETVDSSYISVVKRDSFLLQKLETSKTGIRITVTEFSLPDSLGKQYPIKVTDININQEGEIQENEVSGSQIKAEGTEIDKGIMEDKSRVETKEEKDNRPLSPLARWLLIGGIAVTLLSWLVRKRR
ncbi:hypothetical protein [Parabacteroides pacaensis]|uniref:hypothetical protein n=1 Tax=Parabacteroides pacaensis TaxID=2086575 RepID=UPI000D0F906A|nr:hypothetical protein [Parabacteroides pacaensis]